MQTTQVIKKAKSRRKKGRPRKYRPGEVIGFYTKLQSDAYYLLKQRARERNTSMLKLLHQLIFENLDGRYAKKTERIGLSRMCWSWCMPFQIEKTSRILSTSG